MIDGHSALFGTPSTWRARSAPVWRSPVLLAILALAAGLRLYGLGREGLWNDETLSILMSRGRFDEVLGAVGRDVHPPLHFILCWLWQPIAGTSEWLWRLPSALFGIAAVGAMWRVGVRLLSLRAAAWASLLGATSTMAIYYSQENRSYALLLLLTLVTLERALAWEEGRRARDGLLLWLSTTLLLYTHYFGALALIVFGFWMVLRLTIPGWSRTPSAGRRPDWRGVAEFAATQAAALLAFVPWIWTIADQASRIQHDFWLPRPGADWLPLTYAIFLGVARPVWGGSRLALGELGLGLAVALPLVVGLLWWQPPKRSEKGGPQFCGAVKASSQKASVWALGTAWLVAPASMAYLLSQGPLSLYSHRNLIVSLPAWWLLAAAAIERIPRHAVRAFALTVALAPAVSGALWYHGTLHREQWRELAAEVARGLSPSDHVSVEDPWLVDIFNFHLGELPYRSLSATGPEALRDVRRLWLVRGPSQRSLHLERVNRELAALQLSGFRVSRLQRFIGADLAVLDRPPLELPSIGRRKTGSSPD